MTETQPLQEVREEAKPWQFVKWVFKALYSPMKTFEEIIKKPTIKGPLLILLITLPLTIGAQYTSGTKFFLESPTPTNESWTELPSNSTTFIWSSNDNITFDDTDYIQGNYSVSTSLSNTTLILMDLTGIGSFNASSQVGSSRIFFGVKWVNPANVTPNGVLQLFSFNDEAKRFVLDLRGTDSFDASSTDVWTNVSIDLATDDWMAENSPSWENLTGIGFQLEWGSPANVTVKIDDLFLGKYASVEALSDIDFQILYPLVRGVMSFLLEWLVLSGVALLALKSFSTWTGVWRDLFAVVGYIYSASIVYLVALLAVFFVLPPLFVPFNISYDEYLGIYQNNWGIPLALLNVLLYSWTTGLCAVSLKKLGEISWLKAFTIGFGAVVLSLLFSSFLLGAFSL